MDPSRILSLRQSDIHAASYSFAGGQFRIRIQQSERYRHKGIRRVVKSIMVTGTASRIIPLPGGAEESDTEADQSQDV